MLTPIPPDKSDPLYREKKEQYRLDREDRRQHPGRWGFVRGSGAAAGAPAVEEGTAE